MKYAFKKKGYTFLISIFDIVGNVLFSYRILFRKKLPSNPLNILIVRLDHIGDFVCTTPLFKNLKTDFPDSKITVIVNSVSKELALGNPYIDKVISFSPFYLSRNEKHSFLKGLMRVVKDVRNIGFDLGIEPRGDIISILLMWLGRVKYSLGYGITGGGFLLDKQCVYDGTTHIVDRNLSLLEQAGIPVEDKLPAVYFNDKDRAAVDNILGEMKISDKERLVVLHPYAGTEAKQWPKDNFQNLIDELKAAGHTVILAGSKNDLTNYLNAFDVRGCLNLPQLACLIKTSGLFIGLDSGPANMAAALGVPSVIICSGTNLPQLWIPKSDKTKFLFRDVDCRPCESKRCPKSEHYCMNSIKVEDVMKAVKELCPL